MRVVAVVLTCLAVVVTSFVPMHRCASADCERGVVVMVGSHAHHGHDGSCCDEEHPGAPCRDATHEHDESCCEDSPADPVSLSAGAGLELPAPIDVAGVLPARVASSEDGYEMEAWQPPDRRLATETVVLLR